MGQLPVLGSDGPYFVIHPSTVDSTRFGHDHRLAHNRVEAVSVLTVLVVVDFLCAAVKSTGWAHRVGSCCQSL